MSLQPQPSNNDVIEDLNQTANAHFRALVEADETLSLPWKESMLELSKDNVPTDLKSLESLLETPVSTGATQQPTQGEQNVTH